MAFSVYFMMLTLSILLGTSVQQSTAACMHGWSQFQGSCYLYVDDEWVTWDEAKTGCTARGAILAEPDSQEKIQYLFQTARAWGWLGATDRETEGSWVWDSSGRPIDSSLWVPGEPAESYSDVEDCLAMGYNGWYNYRCTFGRHYVCQQQSTG